MDETGLVRYRVQDQIKWTAHSKAMTDERWNMTGGTGRGSLPRSLSPLTGESLPGYILRLAHRLGRSPTRIGQLTGLAVDEKAFRVNQLVALRPRTLTEFAAATRLTADEVVTLGLRPLASAYTPLARAGPQSDGRVVLHSPWAFTAASRFCPTCLIGDHSPIQHAHGGAWQRHWHLPVVFACTRHQRLLNNVCPDCHRPINDAFYKRTSLVLYPTSAVQHPARCRNISIDDPARGSSAMCGADLSSDHTPTPALPLEEAATYFALQLRIEQHLTPLHANPTYFREIVLVAQLIKLSWPASMEFAPLSSFMGDLLDVHVEGIRRELTQAEPESSLNRRVTGPPAQSLHCAALLLHADRLLSIDEPGDLYDAMHALAEHAFRRDRTRFRSLIKNASLSQRLARAMAPQSRGFYTGRRTRGLQVPSRDSKFTARHVPQLVPLDWYVRHLQEFCEQLTVRTRDNVDHVRRAASLKLVEMAVGGTRASCAELLGMPITDAKSSIRTLRQRSPESAWVQFLEGVEAIAFDLERAPVRTDFGRRRDKLSTWEIPGQDWEILVRDLRSEYGASRHRQVGSIIVWTIVTEGDHLFSPHLRANGTGERLPDAIWLVAKFTIYRAARRGGMPILRARLARYAKQIAIHCDRGLPLSQVNAETCLRM
ncbi:TniQ family protein [Streptomyces sp. NPDC008001]|uniref:TniQ family protein n=1 Tax=Streptomyces sp. NPDC008001 TaxID=3364804 RepID=UPI0036EB249F